jgi:hypothetical protein
MRAHAAVGLICSSQYMPLQDSLERDGAVISALNGIIAANTTWGF